MPQVEEYNSYISSTPSYAPLSIILLEVLPTPNTSLLDNISINLPTKLLADMHSSALTCLEDL